jgi:hypothetical protein
MKKINALIAVDGLGGIIVLGCSSDLERAVKDDDASDFFTGYEKLEKGLYEVVLQEYFEPADVHGPSYFCCDVISEYKKLETKIQI